jgi:nucleoporin NUP1
MKDEGRADRTLGRKEAISPDKNGTKPYAGEGDMKRMLAKRKLELEEEGEERAEVSGKVEEAKGEKKDEGIQAEKVEALPSLPKEIPPPPKDDWYSLASGTSSGAGGSSLRVGRAKSSRNHISRPTARPKAKFSAAFDEEGDDAMVDEDKEREMIEEAAKKAPAFNIPAGFSFAKDVRCLP